MVDKDNQRDIGFTEIAENDGEMELEQATATVTLRSTTLCTPSSPNTLGSRSSRVYSNSHHTQVRRSTDNREEDLLLESENRRRQYGSSGSSDSLVRMQDQPLNQPTCLERCDVTDVFSSRAFSSGQLDRERVQSVAQPLENLSLQTTTTPQQESCGRHVETPPNNKSLDNATVPRRTDCVDDVERFQSK